MLTEYSSDGLNQLCRCGSFKLYTWQDVLVEEGYQDGIVKDLYCRRIDSVKRQHLALKSLILILLTWRIW